MPQELAAEYEGQDMEEDFQLDEKIAGLVKKSKQTGVPYGVLKKSYDRGMAAWKTGHRPGTTPQQWAFARVNSMLTGGKADPDLQGQVRAAKKAHKAKKKKEEFELGEEQIQTWYESVDTRIQYQLDHGDDWWWKLNEVHDKILEKLGFDEGCSIDEETPKKPLMKIDEFSNYNKWGEISEKAEYDGRPVELNNPTRGDVKKYKVYVKNDKGNVVKVEFGDPNMEIKRDDPERRKNFRARHNCDNPGPKYKARFWSCKFWEKGKSVTDLMKG